MKLPEGYTLQGGKYKIEKSLGQGGFGITYQAVQVALKRKVAIKEFFMNGYCERDDLSQNVKVPTKNNKEFVHRFKEKFIKEAENIAALSHPYIIRIHDIFEENGTAYYVMEFHGCGSLQQYVFGKGRLEAAEALRYIRQMADALACVHEQQMCHLDIKPGNVLLDARKNAILIDFGFSKRYDEEGHQTSTTPIGISEGYAPTEQYLRGGVSAFTPATDIYSLGATLYKLLTGERPPGAETVLNDGLPAFPQFISATVANAIEKAMEPRKKDRPQSITEFLKLLDGEEKAEEVIVAEPEAPLYDENTAVLEQAPKSTFGVSTLEKENSPLSNSINGHEYVDLDLSVKWATCNVGATKPEEYGDYFAWGEVKPKDEYTEDNSVTYGKDGFSDISGDARYDAARAQWGGSWRLPTESELEELKNECTWEWERNNGIAGYKVTGPNGNSIFVPSAGYCRGMSLYRADSYGYYWSASPYESTSGSAHSLNFNSSRDYVGWSSRYRGRSVRPVTE